MEDQVYKKLTASERELLGTLFETQSAKAVARAGFLYQEDKALHIAMTAPDMENVLLNRGMIQGARFMYDLMKYCSQRMKKEKA